MSSASCNGSSSPGSSSVAEISGWPSTSSSPRADGMIGHADADRLARRMRQPPRHFPRRLEDEGVRARRDVADQPVLGVVDLGVVGDLRQVAAQQRQVMALVDAADPPHAVDRGLVVEMAHQRVAGVGRERADAAMIDHLRGLPQQPQLRIDRVNDEELRHRLESQTKRCHTGVRRRGSARRGRVRFCDSPGPWKSLPREASKPNSSAICGEAAHRSRRCGCWSTPRPPPRRAHGTLQRPQLGRS
jgi:hypothetical protein